MPLIVFVRAWDSVMVQVSAVAVETKPAAPMVKVDVGPLFAILPAGKFVLAMALPVAQPLPAVAFAPAHLLAIQ